MSNTHLIYTAAGTPIASECAVCLYVNVRLWVYVRVFSSEFVVVVLASQAARHVAAARLVLVNWMAKRPGRGESLML